ncbi:hypothetical protein [Aequorivita lipolytica]|uniref:SGNH/GDSL hydrolase family protein n=1 Tax=Aequorivita lipolytica TaxID=153267 RepID=A0A5C6YL81_9FLAO|nr:hypothetical protein [Aequorivita lipolytica]TXD68017.1 hypothetical protein ESV24_13990 [Aequorivita lipolytica]
MPVVIAYIILEIVVVNTPINFKIIGQYYREHSDEIELIGLGSSQMQSAFNPAYAEVKAINFASKSQHHNEDFHILKQTRKNFPKLKYVLLEVSYSHLELPHHRDDYWKNSIYLNYYGVNGFGRLTTYKDKLLYLSNPRFFSNQLTDYYIFQIDKSKFNQYGFDTNNYDGPFNEMGFDEAKIAQHNFQKLNNEDLSIFNRNTAYLYRILDYTKAENLQVIICTTPFYKTYLKARNPNILRRRDSILQVIEKKYGNITLLFQENDTLHFTVRDFINENHLNPDGAKKFTGFVNQKLDSLN